MYQGILISTLMLFFQARSTLPPRPPTAGAVDEIIFKGFPFQRNVRPAELKPILGDPLSITGRGPNNPNGALHFKGLTIELREILADGSAKIASIELSDNAWRFPAKVRIGSTRDDVLKLLGRPDIESKSELTYGCYECVYDDKIHFTFDGNKVTRIKWDFYLN